MMLKVNEIFPTFQGEGTNVGMPCTFLRLAICNLHCIWCDTAYTWNFGKGDGIEERFGSKTVKMQDEVHEMETAEVAKQLFNHETKNLVISGGEPMLQQAALSQMFKDYHAINGEYFSHIEIETNGTVPLSGDFIFSIDQINCSPKLENSGNPKATRYRPDVLRQYNETGKAWFKFVVASMADMVEIDGIVKECRLKNVMLMALGKNKDQQEAWQGKVSDIARANGWHFSPRLHVLMYGNKRGV